MIVMILFGFCITATVIEGQRELPVKVFPVTIPGTFGECPSDDNRQASHNLLQNAKREIINQIYTNPGNPVPVCGPGEWRRVFFLDTGISNHTCTGQWNLVTSPIRGCAGADSSCSSAFSDDINIRYNKVCGRITGEAGITSPDAFRRFSSGHYTIETNYLDGVSVTHGPSGSRTHIWSFGAGYPPGPGVFGRCPCDSSDRGEAPFPPPEVGENYFCDRDDQLDHLWSGHSCSSNNPCCSFHNPPYFSVQLPSATTDRIELRICVDQALVDETVLVQLAELYVQ